MKEFSQAIAAAGHFSKSERSGAPPVISVNVERQTRVILSTDDVGHPPGVLYCLARFSVQDKSLMLLTQGLGPQPFHCHVVILVNEFTNSAGEMAAQFAKDTKLATLVGEKTMGNVLGSRVHDV
jgi:C-terminal processing protease CtpA/Prc